jgi:hypothetical protein
MAKLRKHQPQEELRASQNAQKDLDENESKKLGEERTSTLDDRTPDEIRG